MKKTLWSPSILQKEFSALRVNGKYYGHQLDVVYSSLQHMKRLDAEFARQANPDWPASPIKQVQHSVLLVDDENFCTL